MAIRYSTPGVYRTETDISQTINPVGTSTGAIVGRFKKGPINRAVLVQSDTDFIDTFGTPVYTSGASGDANTPEMGFGSYAALEFLKASNALYVARSFGNNDKYATVAYDVAGTSTGAGVSAIDAITTTGIPDSDTRIWTIDNAIASNALIVGAKGPGLDGNNISVTVETCWSGCDWFNSYDVYTSASAVSARPIASKVFKLNVYTKTDSQTWNTGTFSFASISASPVESFYGTISNTQDVNKNNLKISNVVNGNSKYIYVACGNTDFNSVTLNTSPVSATPLIGGTLDVSTGLTDTSAWSIFNNREYVSVNILIGATSDMTTKKVIADLAFTRKDCISVLQSGSLSATNASSIKSTSETYGYSGPSYVALYAGWDKFYDKYNDKYVYLPKCIFGAKAMALTDANKNVWDAPAGYDVGILNSVDQYKTFSSNEIGTLYDGNINTSKNVPGVGNVLWGQKTAQLQKSALDRINVRRLLLYIENTIEQTLNAFLFKQNTVNIRSRITNIIDGFLNSIKAAQGLYDYNVICDSTNNTPAIIDANTLVCTIILQPTKTIEFIQLNTVITATGANITEVAI